MSVVPEILRAYVHALASLPPAAWLVLAVPPLLAFLRWAPARPAARWRGRALLAFVVVSGLCLAWQLRWIGDDAYISFRFARHLVDGNGLVFNVGERVEGYTDFLWTILLAGAMALRIHPVVASLVMSLASFVVVILALHCATTLIVSRKSGVERTEWPTLGATLAAGGLLLASHATSGLTTMFAAALVLLAYWQAELDRPFVAGLLGVAAALAHPDHGLFYATLGLALVLRRPRLMECVRYAAPFLLVYVPYFVWRWQYYGDLVPNTFRCKSADLPYYSQGWIYVFASALAMGAFAVLPLAAVGAWSYRRSRLVIAAVFGIPAFLAYTARVGGDFMIGRFAVTPVLLLLLLAGLGFERLLQARSRVPVLALGVLAATAILPARLVAPLTNAWYLADEGSYYPLISLHPPRVDSPYAIEADTLKKEIVDRGFSPKIAIECVGIVGYETALPIFDIYGLTTREVAMTPVWERKRPGHEKQATPGQVLASGAELSRIPVYPPPYDEITRTGLSPLGYYLAVYRSPLGPALTASRRTRDPHVVLSSLADALPSRRPTQQACDTWFAREFYFRHQQDAELARRWVEAMPTGLPPDDAVPLLLEGAEPGTLGYQEIGRSDFNRDLSGWSAEGAAFEGNPVAAAVRGQEWIVAVDGSFIDTFQATGGDAPTGRLVSAEVPQEASLVTFWLGGWGRGQHVRLLEGDEVMRTASPCQCDTLRREAWPLPADRRAPLRIEIVDGEEAAEGHVIADDFRFWSRH